ncbi:hypothetical protein PVK06_041618 [Gossypium arboreum]|uniref:Uncharacterized protein n=1 Tax=Gossypium arboreum TaxID=29729 RepID=A0ABR0N8P8_GOSAR|nr:hypothetical protein PVK06_041618 [Gossypium arboreum]
MRLNGFFLLGKRIRVKLARYNGRRKLWRNALDLNEQEQSVETAQKAKGKERLENMVRGEMNAENRIVQGYVED